ncbi:tyrosine-type recombinase/integrase [Mycobacterium sp. 141]|uniref:tyrosine-type recombinase/integrase n=1 Tax=Mycobacterium sp. 141 TaxID=1120797 RepID=UPI0003A77871|nr:tyrosine-type recombinase/integrase [Mycobacterium sp. 141]
MAKCGPAVTLTDAAGAEVFRGDISAVDEWVSARAEAAPPGPDPQEVPPLWSLWVQLFVTEQLAAKRGRGTIQTRVNHLMMFARRRPHLAPLTVTRDDLVHYLGEHNHWSPRTTHSFRSTFRVFFRLLCQLGHREDDPASTLPAVMIPRSLPRPCPDSAVRQAYAEALDDPRLRLALKIAVETGLRPFEIAKVRGSDVEGWQGAYTLRVIGKGGHQRNVPITDELAARLAVGSGYVFANARSGDPISRDRLAKLIAAALPGEWTTYTLRHRFATKAYQQDRDIRAVQEMLGHASPTTTAIYTKVADESMRRAASAALIE